MTRLWQCTGPLFPELQSLYDRWVRLSEHHSSEERRWGPSRYPNSSSLSSRSQDEAATSKSLNCLRQRHTARADPRSWPPVNPRVRRGRTSRAVSGWSQHAISTVGKGKISLVQAAGPGRFRTRQVRSLCSRASDAFLAEKVRVCGLGFWKRGPRNYSTKTGVSRNHMDGISFPHVK